MHLLSTESYFAFKYMVRYTSFIRGNKWLIGRYTRRLSTNGSHRLTVLAHSSFRKSCARLAAVALTIVNGICTEMKISSKGGCF